MAQDPEAQAQLARLLGDQGLRSAGIEAVNAAVEAGFDRLVEGIVAEAAASDDVTDRDAALSFVELRLATLAALLSPGQKARLIEAVQEKIAAW